MKDTIETTQPSPATSAVNYILNRSMPFICSGGLLFYACGYDSLIPYAVLGFMWFASRFSFGCGFASAVMNHEIKTYMAVSLEDFEDTEDDTTETNKEERK
jgi:hypothetical protein